MPTPFVVAYEEIVPDRRLAERLIHDSLADRGLGVTETRELFSVSLKEAIRVVPEVTQYLRESSPAKIDILSDQDEPIEVNAAVYLQKGINVVSSNFGHD